MQDYNKKLEQLLAEAPKGTSYLHLAKFQADDPEKEGFMCIGRGSGMNISQIFLNTMEEQEDIANMIIVAVIQYAASNPDHKYALLRTLNHIPCPTTPTK